MNRDIFFSPNFKIQGNSINVIQDEFMYTILFKSNDNLYATSLKIKFGINIKMFSREDEELIIHLINNKIEFNPKHVFSGTLEVLNYLQKLK